MWIHTFRDTLELTQDSKPDKDPHAHVHAPQAELVKDSSVEAFQTTEEGENESECQRKREGEGVPTPLDKTRWVQPLGFSSVITFFLVFMLPALFMDLEGVRLVKSSTARLE